MQQEEDDEAGAEEADPDDDDPEAWVAGPEAPGAGCEPGPVASTAGAVEPPGLAVPRTAGASPLPPAPGELPGALRRRARGPAAPRRR